MLSCSSILGSGIKPAMEKRAATVLEELAIEISQLRSQIRAQATAEKAFLANYACDEIIES
jgi:hypothetical protein